MKVEAETLSRKQAVFCFAPCNTENRVVGKKLKQKERKNTSSSKVAVVKKLSSQKINVLCVGMCTSIFLYLLFYFYFV